jgi:hypothetical protein
MFQIAGGAVGLGLATTVFATASEHKLDSKITAAGLKVNDSEGDAAQGILAGTDSAKAALSHFPAQVQTQIRSFVHDAFVVGFQYVFWFCTILSFLGLLVAVFFVGGRLHLRPRSVIEEAPAEESA